MRRVLSVGLLAVLCGAVGCVRYHSGASTSPYYTSYYNTYDSSRQSYYHCCDYRGRGHRHGGGGEHEHHDGGHEHHGGGSGGTGGGHAHGGGHEHSGHEHHSGGSHDSGHKK